MQRQKQSLRPLPRIPAPSRESFLLTDRISLVVLIVCGFLLLPAIAGADLTPDGPSGYVRVPSHTTIKYRQVEWSAHARQYKSPGAGRLRSLTDLAMGFSPIKDFELGFQKTLDTNRATEAYDPDPTVNFKVRLPSMGDGYFSETAIGMILDTNPNNYHSLYFTVGGFGVAWNFGGNPYVGTARYGTYDRGRHQPKNLCLIVGADLSPGVPGERGYRSHYFADYNGDVFSLGWRLKSHRGFWVDAAASTKSTYTDFYDYQPLTIGVGAIF